MRYSTQELRDLWARFYRREDEMRRQAFGPALIAIAPPTADAWRALEAVFLKHDYLIRKVDTGGYADRPITDGTGPSLHAYGIAVDIDWQTNPYRKTPNKRKVLFADKPTQEERAREVRFLRADTDMTPALIADALAIKTKAGLPIFAWGGDFKASKDAMHFQIDVSPQELAEGVDDGPAVVTPPPPEVQRPPDHLGSNGGLPRFGVVSADGVGMTDKTEGRTAMNRQVFYNEIRDDLFSGSLSKAQVAGMEDLLDVWQATYRDKDPRWLAYILATVYHETGRRMVPVREGFATSTEGAVAAVTRLFEQGRIRVNYALPVNGQSYFGRGRVQNTWLDNYRKLEKRFGYPLVSQPDLLISNSQLDATVTVVGHVEGLWTGRKLADFIDAGRCDYRGARGIIGQDRAGDIANYAINFETAVATAYAAPGPVFAPPREVDLSIRSPVGPISDSAFPSTASTQGSTPMPETQQPDLARVFAIIVQLQQALATIRQQQPVPVADPAPQLASQQQMLAILAALLGQSGLIPAPAPAPAPTPAPAPAPTPAPGPIGPVNGALGTALGELLNGKKTAIGVIGALATSVLTNSQPGTLLGSIASSVPALAGMSSTFLPVFLATAAWGVLGKMEKWTQAAPTPTPTPAR